MARKGVHVGHQPAPVKLACDAAKAQRRVPDSSCPAVKQACKTLAAAKEETQHYAAGLLAYGGRCHRYHSGAVQNALSSTFSPLCSACRPVVRCWSSCLVADAAVPGVHSSMHAMACSQLLQEQVGEYHTASRGLRLAARAHALHMQSLARILCSWCNTTTGSSAAAVWLPLVMPRNIPICAPTTACSQQKHL